MANLAFTNYPFAITVGGVIPSGALLRKMPDRLADILNVKDFGAIGDGVTDDYVAIMNAVEKKRYDLTVAVTVPFVPNTAVKATCTTTVSGGVLTALTAVNIGSNYPPYNAALDASTNSHMVTFAGGGSAGGKVMPTAHIVPVAGVVNTAQYVIDTPGANLDSSLTATNWYPGRVTRVTFTSVPSDLAGYESRIYNRDPATGDEILNIYGGTAIHGYATSVDVTSKTVQLLSPSIDYSGGPFGDTSVVFDSDLVAGSVVRFVHPNSGGIFFPPGDYKVSKPLVVAGTNRSFRIFGTGKASKITGNFNDFIFKKLVLPPTTGGSSGMPEISSLWIDNTHATGKGIKFANCVGGAVHDCYITANRGIDTFNWDALLGGGVWGSFEMAITNNTMIRTGTRANSYGLCHFHDGPTINNHIEGFAIGWMHTGGQGGQIVAGNRFELCDIGCQQGITPDGTITTGLAHSIIGNRFVNCGIACKNPGGGFFVANAIEAAQSTIPGDPQYGTFSTADKTGNSLFAANSVRGWFAVAGLYFTGGEATLMKNMIAGNIVNNTNGGAVHWRFPLNATFGEFIENSTGNTYLYADLPPNTGAAPKPNRIEGNVYNITNSNTTTFGAIAAGSGSGHVKVRINAAKDFIVIGK